MKWVNVSPERSTGSWSDFLDAEGSDKCSWRDATTIETKQDSLRAVKIINKPLNPSESLDFNRELEAIAKFSNDRYKRWFVKSFGWFEDPNAIFIAMEYCRHGDLQHYLKRKRVIPVGEVQQLAYQMLEGLDQMHQNDFAHRDLKPGNILIKSMPPEEKWWIVLADFGISKRADESDGPTTTIKGTATFMAPELLGFLDQVRPKSIADFKAADMWALGEIIFQMLTSESTFQNPLQLLKYCTGQQEFPSNRLPISTGDDGCNFVVSIMMALPHDRITTTQCIQHHWMKSLNIEEEVATLDLERSSPLVPEIPQNESASARWTTQATAQWRTAKPLQLNSSSARLAQLESRSSSPPIKYHPMEEKPLVSWKISRVRTLTGHTRGINAVAFSADGKTLASGSGDETVRLWDGRTGAALHTLKAHKDGISALAFLPDGKILASASYDHKIILWDVGSGKPVHILEGHTDSIFALVLSPDGRTLVSGSRDNTVRIWETVDGWPLHILRGHTKAVWAVRLSPNGKTLASTSQDCTVRLWDGSSGAALKTLDGLEYYVRKLAFSPDSKMLALASENNTVGLWDVASGRVVDVLKGHTDSVTAVAFSPDGKILASASPGDTIRFWDGQSGVALQTLEGHRPYYGLTEAFAFSPDGKMLASGSGDNAVGLYDGRSGAALQTLKGHTHRVTAVAFSPDGKTLASVSRDCTVRLWT